MSKGKRSIKRQMSRGKRRLVELLFWVAMTGLFFFILLRLSVHLPENF